MISFSEPKKIILNQDTYLESFVKIKLTPELKKQVKLDGLLGKCNFFLKHFLNLEYPFIRCYMTDKQQHKCYYESKIEENVDYTVKLTNNYITITKEQKIS